jgi:hypothetical protein
MLNPERLRELLAYDPETGAFTWRVGQRAGKVAGSVHSKGYARIWVGGRSYRAHRLAWLYVTGAWPVAQLDHANGARDDNRFVNLREATNAENGHNRKTNNPCGFKGVRQQKKRWCARIGKNGRRIFLGLFATPEEAHAAYVAAATEHHGEFARAE